ncbi:MAG: DUF2007 domain-containing protein [Candidatus Binataceae bacterium]
MPNQNEFAPDQLEEVFSSIDSTQVEMAHDLLQSSGLDCFVFDAQGSRMLGSTAAVPARLMVRAADAAEARERLKELEFED